MIVGPDSIDQWDKLQHIPFTVKMLELSSFQKDSSLDMVKLISLFEIQRRSIKVVLKIYGKDKQLLQSIEKILTK